MLLAWRKTGKPYRKIYSYTGDYVDTHCRFFVTALLSRLHLLSDLFEKD
jgi:hypothetical protein